MFNKREWLCATCSTLLVIRRPCGCVKRAVPVAVAFATRDGVCETACRLRQVPGWRCDLVGARGERWPVRRELFVSTYSPIPQTNMGNDGVYFKRPSVTFALED